MAEIRKREVTLLQKLNQSAFVKLNNEVYGGTSRELGASNVAEKTLLANDDLLKGLLPTVLGIDIKSSRWQDVVSKYLYSISIDVPKGGKILDTSISFSLADSSKQANIKKLKGTFKTSAELADYVLGFSSKGEKNVEEVDIYKYGTPTNMLDYFNYIYCSYHNRVANTQELINKSPRIEYYMVTKQDMVAAKRKKYELTKRINRALLKVDEDEALFESMCSVLNITDGDVIDKGIKLAEIAKNNPKLFIESINDKNLKNKALIELYIRKGILKRNPNSSMIIDANDPTVIIGTNMNTALTFFSNSNNDGVLTQYAATIKNLM